MPQNALVADGNQIQTSAYRAIKNGIKLKDVFQIVKNFNTQGEEASIIGKLEKNLKNKNIIIEDKNKIWHN